MDPPAPSGLANRFYAQQILATLSGQRVRFKVEVQREEFTVPAGMTGIARPPFMVDGKLVAAVELDDPPPGAAQFDNEVHWMEDFNLFDFEDEIELETPSA